MPTALITGVTGQDGSYLAERLLAAGYDVHGLVHRGDPHLPGLLEACPQVTPHEGDLADAASLVAVVEAARPDEVYNLAGISSVGFSWEHPVLTADVTALGAGRLLEAVWQQQQSGRPVRFLQASSAEIFGNADQVPQDESTPVRPTSPYGAAKAYAHHLVAIYRSRGLHAVSAILYNHESPRRPPTFVTRKIARGVAQIVRGEATELVLGDLDARRDWGWAPDYVDAMVRALRHPAALDYVVATGQDRSVRDFVAAAFAHGGITDWERYVRVDPTFLRPAEVARQVGDAGRAREVLGWVPTVTFEELVGALVDAELVPQSSSE
jgi:GDPmannose 4,6-dehydratase